MATTCKWEQRKTLTQRVARIVPSAFTGAVQSANEASVLTIPSPRLQAQISFPNTPQPSGQFWSWLDATNAATQSTTPAAWGIYPIIEPATGDLPSASLFQSVTAIGAYLRGQNVFGTAKAPMADVGSANDSYFSPSYVISGEVTRRWLIEAILKIYGNPVDSYASLCVEITPAPGVDMSHEEWAYWYERCTLQSLTSNAATPPALKSS